MKLTGDLTDEYIRVVDTLRVFRIERHESWEESNQLRDKIRPATMKIRFQLRELYGELYKNEPEFEDSFEKFCEENEINETI